MKIPFSATVQAEHIGQMVKMEVKHETNAIFAFTTPVLKGVTEMRFLFE